MGDGTANGPEMGLVQQGETLQNKQGVHLYKDSRFDVFVPAKPKIPLNEGLDIKISSDHDSSDSPREVLSRYSMALGAASLIAESSITQDVWANTRIEQGQTVSAYGRVPETEKSWRKPVDTNQNTSKADDLEKLYDTKGLQRISGSWFPTWEKLTSNLDLFKNGVNGKDINEISREGLTIWENDKLKLEIIANAPHIKGLHLVVHPKEGFRRQWQIVNDRDAEQIYIQKTLEATAVAIGVQKLLAEGRGEIHNSGNWAGDLKSTEEGGKLNFKKLAEYRNWEKRTHRPDIAIPPNQINTGMHVHVYIPSEGPVILPEMSKQEAIERGRGEIVKQWEEIPPTSPAQIEEIKAKLGEGKLTNWLEQNCKGKLLNQIT
jgi:hypothetical protein